MAMNGLAGNAAGVTVGRVDVELGANASAEAATGSTAVLVTTTNPVPESSVFRSENFDPHAMTPESLMFYLKTRLGGLDKQMNEIFEREQKGELVRAELHKIQEMLTTLKSGEKPGDEHTLLDVAAFNQELLEHLNNINAVDPQLAMQIQTKIYGEGQVMSGGDASYTTSELQSTKDFLNIVAKDLDSSSQMDMIALQQLMSTRQTAIQLATNLVAACGESVKSVVSNIR
ncbi:MAG: hypothetical protein ACOY0T_41310 [Myxococcota bacterium]